MFSLYFYADLDILCVTFLSLSFILARRHSKVGFLSSVLQTQRTVKSIWAFTKIQLFYTKTQSSAENLVGTGIYILPYVKNRHCYYKCKKNISSSWFSNWQVPPTWVRCTHEPHVLLVHNNYDAVQHKNRRPGSWFIPVFAQDFIKSLCKKNIMDHHVMFGYVFHPKKPS